MGNELLASKVITQREPPDLLTITGVPTSSVGAVGVAEWGPIGEPTLISSWPEFKKIFGNFLSAHHLPVSVFMALKSPRGSKRIWVIRVTHYTDPDDKATTIAVKATTNLTYVTTTLGAVTSGNAGPWNLESGQTLDVHCDEDVGGPDTATFTGTAARLVGGAFGVVTAGDIVFFCDGDPDNQTVTFLGGETVLQVAALVNDNVTGFRAIVVGAATVDFESDTEGTSSDMRIISDTTGTAAEIGHTAPSSAAGAGNVADIDAVTFLEAKAIVEAAVVNPVTGVTCTEEVGGELTITSNGTPGPTSSIQIEVASTAADFTFDNLLHQGGGGTGNTIVLDGKYEGARINSWVARVAAATSGEVARFNLTILDDAGAIMERWPNLIQGTAAAADPRYIDTLLNDVDTGSKFVTAADIGATDQRPTNGDYTLAGGDDGLAGIADADFLGLAGLGAYAWTPEFIALKAIPGKTSAAINQALVADGEATGCFAVLDPPSGLDATAVVAYTKVTAALYELSEYAELAWPWCEIPNPDESVYGSTAPSIFVPTSGPYLQAALNNDARPGGVHEAPAGIENGRLWGVIGVEHRDALNPDKLDVVYPARVNPITRLNVGGSFFIDGSRTLLSTGPFPSVGESRGVIFIEQSVKAGTEWVRHRNIVRRIFRRINAGIVLFLTGEMKKDAFATRDPATAFMVDIGTLLNPPSEAFAKRINIKLSLAKAKPGEWVIITVTQDIRLLQEELGLAD